MGMFRVTQRCLINCVQFCHLAWKNHILHIALKIKRIIGILCKIRHCAPLPILRQLCYTLIYPHLTYAIIIWGNTYPSSLTLLITLQKKALRIITFSDFRAPSSPLFHSLGILKLNDVTYLNNCMFMYDFHSNTLPSVFHDFFLPISNIHTISLKTCTLFLYCQNKNKLWQI